MVTTAWSGWVGVDAVALEQAAQPGDFVAQLRHGGGLGGSGVGSVAVGHDAAGAVQVEAKPAKQRSRQR